MSNKAAMDGRAPPPQAIYGIIFMLLNTVSLAVLDISSKALRSEFSSSLIVFIYKFSLFVMILPWVFIEGRKRLKTRRLHFHILRSFLITYSCYSLYHFGR